MSILLDLIISGLVGGGLAAMIAVGLVMTYTTTGIFNFAQGSVAFLAAVAFMELHLAAGLPTLVSALITVLIIAPLSGIFLEVWVFRRLSQAPELARIVGTVGLALAIPAFVILALEGFGRIPGISARLVPLQYANPISLGPEPSILWHFSSHIIVSSDSVIILGLTVTTALVYWFILRRTRIGLEMRAAVDGHQLASIRGVSRARVSRWAWVLSFASAALVGVCGSIQLGLDSNSYLVLLFIAAAAAVIGGLRSIPLAFAGALLLGVAQNLVSTYLQKGPLSDVYGLGEAVPFIALLVGLYVMSRRRGRVAGTVAVASDAPVELTRDRRNARQRARIACLVLAAGLAIFFLGNAFWDGFVAQGLCMSIIFLSFVITTGQGGVVSLAQAGFVTCGGLVAGWLTGVYGLPMWVAVIVAVIAAMIAGVIVAIPAIRLGGLQLALATLALAYLFDQLIFQIPAMSNQSTGWFIPKPRIGSFQIGSNRSFSILVLLVLIVFVILVRNFQLSQTGRSVLAARGSLSAAVTNGISIARPRIVVFAFAAAMAGVGGFFLSQSLSAVTSESNPPLNALLWVTIAIVVGVRRPAGAIVAGMTSVFIPEFLSYVTTSTEWPLLLFGVGAVALAQYPGGTLDMQIGQIHRLRDRTLAVWAAHGQSRSSANTREDSSNVVAVPKLSPLQSELERVTIRRTVGAVAESKLTPQSQTTSLQIEGIHAGYGELEVLHGISLAVKRGKITALFGANGSGKSTLCSVLAGLIDPKLGEVILDGVSLSKFSGRDRLQEGLFVVTESRSIFPNLTVEENLRVALRSSQRVEEALNQSAELSARRDTPAGMLSGGEQQLLAMAPALVLNPKVLVADEPTLGLAPLARQRVLGVCRELRNRGTTVLLIEERPGEIFEMADEIVLLRLGRIEWHAPREEVTAQSLIDSYLAV